MVNVCRGLDWLSRVSTSQKAVQVSVIGEVINALSHLNNCTNHLQFIVALIQGTNY